MSFDAGYAADDKAKLGTHAMMLALMDEGTRTRSSIDIAEEQERLGAVITPEASMDRTDVSLFALKPNLAPSLALFADIVRNPARSEEHTSELPSLMRISYAVFCLKKKKNTRITQI